MASLPYFWDDSLPVSEIMELEIPLYSKSKIADAGKLLAKTIPASEMNNPEVLEAFRIAWNWRNSHILPMRKMRSELSHKARRVNPLSVTAARPKRMKSIRQKLGGRSLYDLQDLAGCRAIMGNIAEIKLLLAAYEDGARHTFKKIDDYITNPRPTGYRSNHLMYQFMGEGEEAVYRRHIVEIQLRTQLQHAWATAVEAVGLVRNEDLKRGHGDADWLRFFALMSSEFAEEEDCAPVPNTPENTEERHQEIRDINSKIDAVKSLDAFRTIIDTTAYLEASRGMIFLIQYDAEQREVSAKSVPNFKVGSEQMRSAELRENGKAARRIETVLVEVDAASDLRKAYPNYFLDVGMFVERLRRVIEPKPKKSRAAKQGRSFNFDPWFEWRNR